MSSLRKNVVHREVLVQVRYPEDSDEFQALASSWTGDLTIGMLRLVWSAYDLLVEEILSHNRVSLGKPLGDLERSVTEMLERRIRRCSTGDEPYTSQHEVWEHEGWKGGNARSKQYDIAFVWNSLERVMWPLEAKVLAKPGDVSAYVQDVKDEFETCGYAPYTSGGAMIGYLKEGDPYDALRSVAAALKATLHSNTDFSSRPHQWSAHSRSVPAGRPFPADFRCEHLIMPLTTASQMDSN